MLYASKPFIKSCIAFLENLKLQFCIVALTDKDKKARVLSRDCKEGDLVVVFDTPMFQRSNYNFGNLHNGTKYYQDIRLP